jgi:hypothetical protein
MNPEHTVSAGVIAPVDARIENWEPVESTLMAADLLGGV